MLPERRKQGKIDVEGWYIDTTKKMGSSVNYEKKNCIFGLKMSGERERERERERNLIK